jgi:hypothetical protein
MSRTSAVLVSAQLVAALLLCLFVQVWLLPAEVLAVVSTFPEVRYLATPGIIWGVAAIACVQGIGVVGLRIVTLLSRADAATSTDQAPFFTARVTPWLWAVVGCLLAFLALVIVAYTALAVLGFSTPAMPALIVLGCGAAAASGALALFVRSRPGYEPGERTTRRSSGGLDTGRVDASHHPA